MVKAAILKIVNPPTGFVGSNPTLSKMLQFKYHYLLRIRENIFNSLNIVKFNRPKWEYFRKNLIFKLSRVFFFRHKKKYSFLFLHSLNIRYILSIYLKKRSYFRYTFYNKLLQQLKYKLFYKIKNYMYYTKFYLNFLKKTTRSAFVSLFEMKIFIVLYRLGWFPKLNVSYYFFQLGIIILNFNFIINPYVTLQYGDYISIDFKFYDYIYNNILNRTSFLILPYFNTFLKRRKRWFRRRRFVFFWKNKTWLNVLKINIIKQVWTYRYRYKRRRHFFMNFFIKKSVFIKKIFLYKTYKYLYFIKAKKNLFLYESKQFLYLFSEIFDNKQNLFLNISLNKQFFLFNNNNFIFLFNNLKILFKYYLFQLKSRVTLFSLKRFFWFKKFFFVDRFFFMFPHYLVINFNTLELLVIDDVNHINYNKSCYFFRNLVNDFNH